MGWPISQGVLERLAGGEVVIGDGGFVFALEKRGYVKAGPWTPEAAAEHPEAGMCTHAECTYKKHFSPKQLFFYKNRLSVN